MGGFFSRASSFLSDPRLPIYYPFNLARWVSLNSRMDKLDLGSRPELDVLFTVDLEYDYGSREANLVVPFLKQAKGFFTERGIRATIFMQGGLVADAISHIRLLGSGHEIGLHGHSHEMWGTAWFVKDAPPPLDVRKNLIASSLKAFGEAGLMRPLSFRAPRMVMDDASFRLLESAGFTADSSFPSYAGGVPLMGSRYGITELPVSFDPKPVFGRSLRARYDVFNVNHIVVREFAGGIAAAAMRVAKAQALSGQKPFIVILSHPWEFFTPPGWVDLKQYGYSGPDNFNLVSDALLELERHFRVRYATTQEFLQSRSRS